MANKNFEIKNGLTIAGTERISSSGAFTGSLASATTATTQSSSDNSTKIATTAYTDAAITAVIGGAPGTLDTLNELAAAINDDASYATTLTTALATKLPLAGGTMTGNLKVDASFTVNGNVDTSASLGEVLQLSQTDSAGGFLWSVDRANNTYKHMSYHANTHKFLLDGTTEAMRIKNDGNVGIGNSLPSSLYWPNGSTGGLFLQAGGLLSAYNAGTNLSQNWYYNSGEKFIGNGGASRYVQSGQEHIWSHSTAVNSSGAGAGLTWSESMRIDSSGNVAIGHTTTTGSKFAICDGANSQIQFFPEISTDTNLTQHYDPTAAVYINSETRAASHAWKIGTSESMRIQADGTTTIGRAITTTYVNSQGYPLHVQASGGAQTYISISKPGDNSGDTGLVIGHDASGSRILNREDEPIIFHRASGETMRIDGSGNLGLGVVPTTNWWANATALQISPTAAMWNTSNYEDFNIGNNIYTDGTEKYLQNDAACKIRLTDSGLMDFRVAGAGTAGSAISYITAMAIDSAGVVIIDASQGKATGKHDMEIGGAAKAHGVFLRPYAFFGTRYSAWDTNLGWNAETDAMTTNSGIVQGTSYGASGASNLIVGADTLSWYRWAPAQCTGSGASLAVSSTYLYMQASTSGFNIKGSYLSNASDRRLKDDITPITNALDKVKQLTGNTFTWKTTIPASGEPIPEHKAGKADMGVIAQEVQEVVPTAVQLSPWDSYIKEVDNPNFNGDLETGGPQKISDPDGFTSVTGENYLTVNEEKLVPLLIEAIKELEARVAELEG